MEIMRSFEQQMRHLRRNPKKAKAHIREARQRKIAIVKESYSDVIKAYEDMRHSQDGIVVGFSAYLKNNCLDESSKEYKRAYSDNKQEWNALAYEFLVKHGSRYDEYRRCLCQRMAEFDELEADFD